MLLKVRIAVTSGGLVTGCKTGRKMVVSYFLICHVQFVKFHQAVPLCPLSVYMLVLEFPRERELIGYIYRERQRDKDRQRQTDRDRDRDRQRDLYIYNVYIYWGGVF